MQELDHVRKLSAEVIEFFTSDQLFRAQPDQREFQVTCTRRVLNVRSTSPQQYVDDIDPNNTKSYCEELTQGKFSMVQTWMFDFEAFDTAGSFSNIMDMHDQMADAVLRNRRVEGFARNLKSASTTEIPTDEIISHVQNGLIAWAMQLLYARILTNSRRFGFTEAGFLAIRKGLFPYGYDLDATAIVCVHEPIDIAARQE